MLFFHMVELFFMFGQQRKLVCYVLFVVFSLCFLHFLCIETYLPVLHGSESILLGLQILGAYFVTFTFNRSN